MRRAGPRAASKPPTTRTNHRRRFRRRRRLPRRPAVVARGQSELQHLADLHDAGTLTDDEFAAAKAKVLGT